MMPGITRKQSPDTHLYLAADRGGQLEPLQEAPGAGGALAVEGVAVGRVAAQVTLLRRL